MTLVDGLLAALCLLAVGAGAMVVVTRHVVRAGLWLVVALGAVAGCFLILNAELVAWVQVLIYIGAVVVLLLFATMLTRAPVGARDDLDRRRFPAAAIGLGAGGSLTLLLIDAFHASYVKLDDLSPGTPARLGRVLFRDWVLPFELLSILLLAALVSAVVISRDGR